jgi:predicted metallo-beta-lactamase superfamily hydrolase
VFLRTNALANSGGPLGLTKRVKIIAADSMGVRSLATFVDMCGVPVGIDLGAALAPRRFGLPPHPLEYERLERVLDDIRKFIEESHVVIVTHYHYDHYIRGEPEIYYGKTLIVKSIERDINWSQRVRGYTFLRRSGLVERARVIQGDSLSLKFGELAIEVSKPVWHGEPGSRVGRVLMVRLLCDDESVVFTSDVQGPADPEAVEILRSWSKPKPSIIILGGPPTYFSGVKVSEDAVRRGLEGLEVVVRDVRPHILVVDHHLLRDVNYLRYVEKHIRIALDLGVKFMTAAEYEGRPVEQLEARRRELWGVSGEGLG